MEDDKKDDREAALRLIKEIHQSGGIPMTDAEVVEFISKPIHLFVSDRLLYKRRGRPSQKIPIERVYQEAYERRRGFYQRLVRLPKNRIQAKATRSSAGSISRDEVNKAALEELGAGVKLRNLVNKVSTKLRRDNRQVRRILKSLRII